MMRPSCSLYKIWIYDSSGVKFNHCVILRLAASLPPTKQSLFSAKIVTLFLLFTGFSRWKLRKKILAIPSRNGCQELAQVPFYFSCFGCCPYDAACCRCVRTAFTDDVLKTTIEEGARSLDRATKTEIAR